MRGSLRRTFFPQSQNIARYSRQIHPVRQIYLRASNILPREEVILPRSGHCSSIHSLAQKVTYAMPVDTSVGNDLVLINRLSLSVVTGPDSWHRLQAQPIYISIAIKTAVGLTGSTEDLKYSKDYSLLSKKITLLATSESFHSLEHLAETIAEQALDKDIQADWIKISLEQPKIVLRADCAGLEIIRRKDKIREQADRIFVNNLRLAAILGIRDYERKEKQNVIVSLILYKQVCGTNVDQAASKAYDFRKVVNGIIDHVENSAYLTIEALVTGVARLVCTQYDVDKITVKAEKPSAVPFAASSAVEITRSKSSFQTVFRTLQAEQNLHTAFIALGSNMGDKLLHINSALSEMKERGIKVLQTSSMYESAPMYYTEQETFLNAVSCVQTSLSPHELLHELQSIERYLNRIKTIEKGPRTIDLDVLLYDSQSVTSNDLIIPHSAMLEREFVLRPMCDIAPDLVHPLTCLSFNEHLSALSGVSTVNAVVALSPSCLSIRPQSNTRPTNIMAIINATPDSFSDGGKHSVETITELVSRSIAAGAGIIDIGGMSSRPGATDVSVDEEIRRVVPFIKAIRSSQDTRLPNIAISVDTFRASVAEAAVKAGANIINDISGGLLDKDMLRTAAELAVPIVLMHMRGTPQTMSKLADYPDGVVETVGRELEDRVLAAQAAGVRRWQILLDPGIGFAKNQQQNLELMRRLCELRERPALKGLPWVLGPSRKRFIGNITGVEDASQRQWGTASAITACIAGGADIVRVHDVDEMSKVAKMADAIWRV